MLIAMKSLYMLERFTPRFHKPDTDNKIDVMSTIDVDEVTLVLATQP